MHKQLDEMVRKLHEVVPQDRNFDIEIKESGPGVDILLKHKESDQELNLGGLLPPEHFFGKDKIFGYAKHEKKIGFPENDPKFRGFFLALLHEIGHSHEKREHAPTYLDNILTLGYTLKKLFKYLVTFIKKKERRKVQEKN